MQNPFEDQDRDYLVLINVEEQYSLWPSDLDVPDGWRTVYGEKPRAECLEHIEAQWKDMRPASLVKASDAAHRGR
ncbi:MbtH family protein [Actinomadura sp. DC4]|uniref:MbtH family protein n=1 Tax=Actinomadura sp. DC4 TaxID=3055069 RepID=UPI0025AF938E|nr:MbtH family protein [Actinomadura sp. DC4]MDN3351337.1 MbtH family protein [Actinomadura sp. DC4]